MTPASAALAAGLGLASCGVCLADDLSATEAFTDTTVGFELKGAYRDLTLNVAGPNGFHASAFAKTGAPSIDLRRAGALDDGQYRYDLTAATDERIKIRSPLD